jgi:mRNA interferase HigB
MRIISNKALRDFAISHPQSETALQEWRKRMEATTSNSYSELKTAFNSVDKVGNYYIFNIAGNHYRLIAAIHFNTQTVYIRDVLTHKEYDLWKP